MTSSIEDGLSPGLHRAATRAALAAIAETDAPDGPCEYPRIVTGEPDRLDARSVEHTRQSRLQRWQRLP